MKKIIKWIFMMLATAFIVAQFFNPSHENPPVKNDFIAATTPPPAIAAIFRASCYDCHSYETQWPWYSRIAPISWTVAQDVDYGRGNLNLSDWPTNDLTRVAKKLDIMSEDIQNGDMPMKKYTLIHHDARLTENQRKQLTDWLDAQAEKLRTQSEAAH